MPPTPPFVGACRRRLKLVPPIRHAVLEEPFGGCNGVPALIYSRQCSSHVSDTSGPAVWEWLKVNDDAVSKPLIDNPAAWKTWEGGGKEALECAKRNHPITIPSPNHYTWVLQQPSPVMVGLWHWVSHSYFCAGKPAWDDAPSLYIYIYIYIYNPFRWTRSRRSCQLNVLNVWLLGNHRPLRLNFRIFDHSSTYLPAKRHFYQLFLRAVAGQNLHCLLLKHSLWWVAPLLRGEARMLFQKRRKKSLEKEQEPLGHKWSRNFGPWNCETHGPIDTGWWLQL